MQTHIHTSHTQVHRQTCTRTHTHAHTRIYTWLHLVSQQSCIQVYYFQPPHGGRGCRTLKTIKQDHLELAVMGSLCTAVLWARGWLVMIQKGYLTHNGLSEIKGRRFWENTFITPVYRPDSVGPRDP